MSSKDTMAIHIKIKAVFIHNVGFVSLNLRVNAPQIHKKITAISKAVRPPCVPMESLRSWPEIIDSVKRIVSTKVDR